MNILYIYSTNMNSTKVYDFIIMVYTFPSECSPVLPVCQAHTVHLKLRVLSRYE